MTRKEAFLDQVLSVLEGKGQGEFKHQHTVLRFLPRKIIDRSEPIVPGSFVMLSINGIESWALLVPSGGGLVLRFQDKPAQILTDRSPLGNALLGKRVGDAISVSPDRSVVILDHE